MRSKPVPYSYKTVQAGYVKKRVLLVLFVLSFGAALLYSLSMHGVLNLKGGATAEGEDQHMLRGHKLVCLTNPAHARAFELLATWFHEETGAVVQNIVVTSEEMLSYPMADFHSEDPQIDIFMIRYHHLGILHDNNMISDLTQFIEKHESILQTDDYIPSIYAPYSLYDGKRYALPFDGDTHLLFYRKSLLDRHNLNPPKTWEDYLHVSQTITGKERRRGIYGSAVMMHPFMVFSFSAYFNRLTAMGGRLLDDEGNPTVNSPEGVAALEAMLQQAKYALPTPQETDWDVSRDAFLSGKAAMVEQWTDLGIMAEDLSQSLISGDWGVVPLPRGSNPGGRHPAPLNSGFSLAISQKSPNRQAAEAFILFASRPDIAKKLCLSNVGVDPTRRSTLESRVYQEFTPKVSAAIQQVIHDATPWPRMPQASQLIEILSENLIHALDGHLTPREALEHAQREWERILAQ